MADQVAFDVLAKVYGERDIAKLGDEFAKTAVTADAAAASLKVWNDVAAKTAKADSTLVAARASHAKADKLLADAENVLAGRATQTMKLLAGQAKAQDDAGKSAGGLASRFSALAGASGAGGGGMGALIGAGVVLSPILLTLGTGLGGLAAAAYGIAKPIENAARKTGGLSANLALLNPEQRTVAQGLLGLGTAFGKFEHSLQPEVLGLFNTGIQIAGHLLHDVQPVAAATGKALNQALLSVDKEFQSGTWQQFFGFMAQQAAPDMRLLGKTLTDTLQALPGLVKDLQPVAREILIVGDDAAQATGKITNFYNAFEKNVPVSTAHTFNFLRDLDRWTVDLTNHIPGASAVNNWLTSLQHGLTGTSAAAKQAVPPVQQATAAVSDMMRTTVTTVTPVDRLGKATASTSFAVREYGKNANLTVSPVDRLGKATDISAAHLQDFTVGISQAAPKAWTLNAAITALDASAQKLVGDLLTLQGGEVSWRQSLQAARTQLNSNSAGLAGNSAKALANKQAVIASTQAALSFSKEQRDLGGNLAGASRTVQDQIKWLQGLHDKSKFTRDEIHALRQEEALLNKQRINQTINVQGLGQWSVSQSLAPGAHHRRAAGGLIPGHGGGDTYPALLTPGELVVPTPMVRAGAVDHLRGRLPGFAAGGLVPSYAGAVAGLQPWIKGNDAATIHLIDLAVVKATVAGIKAAQAAASAGGFGGHGVTPSGPVQAYARNLVSAVWGAGQWPAFADIVARESGWNVHATNPTSGAYGIPQALPPGKMASAGADWRTNPFTQLRWMVGYIHSRWGTPGNADANERAHQWYGNGLDAVISRPTLIGVGERGAERVRVAPVLPGGGRSSGPQTVALRIEGGSDQALTAALVYALRKHIRVAGGGDVQLALGRS